MIVCPHCATRYPSNRTCPQCGFAPDLRDGFQAWAPRGGKSESGFEADYFGPLAAHEGGNFWFVARNHIVIWALETYCTPFGSFLEIGCGTGFVLSAVSHHFPQARIVGSEVFTEGLDIAARRTPSAQFVQMDAVRCPYVEEFDIVGAFDVLEHIDEDETVLENLFRAVRPGGHLVITVPQHRWLWSAADDYACHRRRYTASELHAKVSASGFVIERTTSFVSLLLPAMLLSRRSTKPFDPLAEFKISPALNKAMKTLLMFELHFISLGLSFPIGGSRLVIAKKPEN